MKRLQIIQMKKPSTLLQCSFYKKGYIPESRLHFDNHGGVYHTLDAEHSTMRASFGYLFVLQYQ